MTPADLIITLASVAAVTTVAAIGYLIARDTGDWK